MFNKGQRIDKLVIRNQVGYHFKKVIREVSQELFVSRKVDLSALLHGIQILEQTKDTMKQYCYDLAYAEASSANKPTSTPDSRSPTKDHIPHAGQRYVSIVSPMLSGFAEAKAKCTALGMKLPEIYTMDQREELRTFLREAGVTVCFAGLQADIPDSTFRFISTGVPIWQGPFDKAYGSDGHEFELVSIFIGRAMRLAMEVLRRASPIDAKHWSSIECNHHSETKEVDTCTKGFLFGMFVIAAERKLWPAI